MVGRAFWKWTPARSRLCDGAVIGIRQQTPIVKLDRNHLRILAFVKADADERPADLKVEFEP